MKKSLIALSSAAVLGVYGAGYVRTRAAAEQFSDEPVRRHPFAPAPAVHEQVTTPAAAEQPAHALPAAAPAAMPAPPVPSTTQPSQKNVAVSPKSVSAPAVQSTATSTPPAAQADAVAPAAVTQAPVAAAPQVAALTADAALSGLPTAALPPATLAAPAASQYVDGTYTGWGTCRHGDIQAKVVIAGGKIASATIAQCLTRYSCSWISPLPPQVVQRQSAETDYVSGATQSTNAFYYAVIEALAVAKKK